jgi:rubrerythrin
MPDHSSRRSFLMISAALLLSGCKENKKTKPDKQIFSDPKFELIDLALQHEFGAVVQYGNHAGVIASLKQESNGITTAIEEIITDEVHHAVLLTQIMKENDVEPSIAVWPPQTAETPNLMIQKDIAAEVGAIKLYQQILSLDFDTQTKIIIEKIMQSEKLHHHMFSNLLLETV